MLIHDVMVTIGAIDAQFPKPIANMCKVQYFQCLKLLPPFENGTASLGRSYLSGTVIMYWQIAAMSKNKYTNLLFAGDAML